jgi:hypothetical protein
MRCTLGFRMLSNRIRQCSLTQAAQSKIGPAVAVLDAGRTHQHHDELLDDVNDDLAFAGADLFGGVIAASVRTVLSTALAGGASAIPALAKRQYTVHGGKSCGSWRHGQPVRVGYWIASMIRRRECFAGRPPWRGHIIGAINSQCASVMAGKYDLGSHAHTSNSIGHLSRISHVGAPPTFETRSCLSRLPASASHPDAPECDHSCAAKTSASTMLAADTVPGGTHSRSMLDGTRVRDAHCARREFMKCCVGNNLNDVATQLIQNSPGLCASGQVGAE